MWRKWRKNFIPRHSESHKDWYVTYYLVISAKVVKQSCQIRKPCGEVRKRFKHRHKVFWSNGKLLPSLHTEGYVHWHCVLCLSRGLYQGLVGRMGGWMYGWTDGCIDGQMERQLDEWRGVTACVFGFVP